MYNKKIVSLEKREKNKKKHTYGPNDARLASFGLYLVVVAIQYPPSCVITTGRRGCSRGCPLSLLSCLLLSDGC